MGKKNCKRILQATMLWFGSRFWPQSSLKVLTNLKAAILRNGYICLLKWRFHWRKRTFIVLLWGVFFVLTELPLSFSSFFVRWQTALFLHAGRICLCNSLFSPAGPSYLLTSVINEPKMAMDLKWLYQLYWSGLEKSKHHFSSQQYQSEFHE